MSAQGSDKGSRPSSRPGSRPSTRGMQGTSSRPLTAASDHRMKRKDTRTPEGPMEDTVTLTVSYTCLIRDRAMAKISRATETPPEQPADPKDKKKAGKGAGGAKDKVPEPWELDPESGWSASLTVAGLESKAPKPATTPICKALERFDLNEGGSCSVRIVAEGGREVVPEAAEGEAPQPGYIEGPTREREFTLKGEASLTFKMNADALFALVGKGGKHQVTLTVAREVQSAAAPEGGPPPTSKDSNGEVKLDLDVDIADLLVQEPKISASFPRRGCPPPEALAQVPELQQVILDFVVRQPAAPVQKTGSQIIPEEGASPSQLSAGAPASSPGAPEPQPYSPGSPRPLLPAGLAKMWNPMVVRPIAAKSLPDAPATPQQLDELCDKVEVRFQLPFDDRQHAFRGHSTPWEEAAAPGVPHTRTVWFDECLLLLLGDHDVNHLKNLARNEVVHFNVFDRVVIVEEPNVVVPPPEHRVVLEVGEDEGDEGDDQVYARAQWPLADLTKRTRIWTRLNLLPGTNLRAAAGLEWKTRPGRYLEAQSYLKMDIKTAVRIQDTTGSPVKHPFQRAIFVMDHRDTDLLHRVERTVKVLNAITLGLIPHPVTDPSPPELPDLPPEPKPEASEVSADGGAETGEPGNARSVDRRVGASRLSRRKSHAHSQVASALDLYHAAVEERHRLMEEYEEAVAMAQVERLEHRYDQVDISQHSLQVMSTKKLTQTEAEDPNLDLLTACQVIDGSLRIILVEGLGNGWMRQISHLCVVASSEENPEHCKRMRKVLWSRLHCHSERVLASLGIHVEQVKLRAPLLDLVAEPGTFSTGRVRELCREGVRRLSNMVRADFTRVAEDLRLFPTGEMIDVVYKKFGGELTKEDVAGWEPPVAGRNRRSTTRERAVSGRSAKGSVKDMEGAGESRGDEGPMEEDARKPYVYPWNEDFLEEKARREEERMRTDWKSLNKAYVRDVEDTVGKGVRESWLTWNPQRTALEEVMAMEDPHATARSMMQAFEAKQAPDPVPGTISAEEARRRSWYPHPQQFRWPYPKDPESFREHPKKPSQARIEDLQQPWEEGTALGTSMLPARADGEDADAWHQPFYTMIQAGGLLEKNKEYFKSVHLTGEGLAKEMAEAKRREKEEWRKRVVVDDVNFHSVIPSRAVVTDLDRNRPWLVDKPRKIGLRVAPRLEKTPINAQLAVPWNQGGKDVLLRKPIPEKWVDGDFMRFGNKERSDVYNRTATMKIREAEKD